MTRLSGYILWLLFILVSVACADTASSEQSGQGAPATSGAIVFTQQEKPSATPTPLATRRHGTPLAQPLDSTATPVPTATATASPTVTPSPLAPTPVPLSTAAIAECPVSLPNLDESPNEYYISSRGGYGNPARTMFIGLWTGGKVYFHPGGPGTQSADGTLGMKFWFYRTVPGDVVIGGQRLDAPAPPMPETVLRGAEDGYGETGFHPAGLVFPGEGCWEVTAHVGDEEMQVVMLVVQLSFPPLVTRWRPEGMVPVDTDLSDYPSTVRQVYGWENGAAGKLVVETSREVQPLATLYPQAVANHVLVNGQSGVCVRGAPDGAGGWQESADASALVWHGGDLQYRIAHEHLGLQCNDLLRVARSTPLSHATPTVTVAPAARPSALEPPASCPVTQPPEPAFDPPGRPVEPIEGMFWYGSDDLYLALPFDGMWSQLALGEKVFWWSENYPGAHEEPEPAMAIRGRQLGAEGETFEQSGATNASHASFPATAMLHGLTVPTPGCWEITGEYKGETLSFVVWVP